MNLKLRKALAVFMTLVLLLGNVNMALAEEVEETGDQSAPTESVDVPQDEPATQAEVTDNELSQVFGKVEIKGQKIWDDKENAAGVRPDSITVNLLANGTVVDSQVVSEETGWVWNFDISNGFPNSDLNPAEVTITISEDDVENYQQAAVVQPTVQFTYPSVGQGGWNKITPCSSLTIQSSQNAKSIVVAKKGNGYICWSVDPLAPFERELIVESAAAAGAGSSIGSYIFISGMPGRSDEFGITVTDKTIEFDGTNKWSWFLVGTYNRGSSNTTASSITNKLEGITVSGAKTWEDNNNQDGIRPTAITINLLANGVKVASQVVTAESGWTWTFNDVDKFADGKEIVYTVSEEPVNGYTAAVSGMNVTNTHVPSEINLTVTKKWSDADNQDGIRPGAITVNLLADGVVKETVQITAENGWSHTFGNLPEFRDGGTKIVYTITENPVNGYEANIEDYTITNTHVPAVITISGSKTWDDAENQDGKRPASITINLMANGTKVASKTVTEADGWAWTFENMPKFEKGVEIVYSITEDAVEGYTTTYNRYNVTNSYTPEETSVTVTKSWQDNGDQDGVRPNDITVKLLANEKETGKTLVLSSGNNWTGSFTELDKYENGKEIVYTVAEVSVSGYTTVITGSQSEGYTITNTHEVELVNVSGSKTWVDKDDQDGARPESITINLLADGEVIQTIEVTEADNWAWTFKELPKFKNHGTEIVYSITEDSVEDYSTTYNGFNVTNTHTPAQTSVTVTKSWKDNDDQDGIRPEDITVKLLANGAETDKTLVLNEGNNWTGSFTELDKYAGGVEIAYSVAEVTVSGYTTAIAGDQATGYTITNTHTPEVVTVSGSKTWVDNNNQDGKRPESITINLLADGEVINTIEVTEKTEWTWSFENLPKYKDHGTAIVYTVTEGAVDEYTTEINGYDVTNTHAPEKTSVNVIKAWEDSNDQDGIRPADVTVVLLANGEETEYTLILSEGNNWNGTFADLDKYENGEVIVYNVAELTVDGYNSVINGDQTTGYTITNSHTPEVVTVSGAKTWDDNDNQDGFRPESITINLLADGEIIDTIEVTEENEWTWTFDNLPKYKNHGTEIVYSITENAIDDYSAEYDGFNVTNTHTPEQTSVTVTKSWQDNDDQDGIRPEEITVILLANGEATGDELVLDAEGSWTGSFTELDVYAEGEKIVYTVEEIEIEGYETVITGDQTTGFQITNSHTPEVIEISGSKTWDDANNQDGVRPESITVNLMANGKVVKTATVTEAEEWSYSFENLPKYENGGNEIIYAITEEAVEGYTTTYDGYNITNSYTPAEISLTVTKAWADSDDEDGLRPSKVTILLYANGEKVDEKLVLNAKNNWSGSFVGLPKYANGEEIVYTIGEVSVKGYNTVIRGSMEKGFVVTNSHTVIPQTGDERTPILWMLMLLGSVAVVGYMGYDYKKRRMAK